MHLSKEQFPIQWCNKLLPRGDQLFQVLEHINDNAYKFDLPGEYGVSVIFNVSNLSPFFVDDALDLRANPSKDEKNDDGVQADHRPNGSSVKVPISTITRAHAKRFKDALQALAHTVQGQFGPYKYIEVELDGIKFCTLIKV